MLMMKTILLAFLLVGSPVSGIRRSETVEQQRADYLLEDAALETIDAEQFITMPTRVNGGLRGEALPELIITEDEFPLHEGGDRELVTTANVRLKNNCGFKASIAIIYYTPSGKVYKWPEIAAGGVYVLSRVSQQTIYLYGRNVNNPNKLVWGTTSSKHCIASGKCLEPRNVGSLSTSPKVYKLCGGGSSPVASPIAQAPPPQASLTTLDGQFLDNHNAKRTDFYAKYGLGPQDLTHSPDLKSSAQNYANALIDIAGDTRCVIQHGYNGDDYGGENLATNWGSSPNLEATSPQKLLYNWFDAEINLPYGQKAHATQVVFRSSHYVGCAQASKTLYHGGKCYIYVCRFLSPGNCNMSSGGWLQRTLDDEVICSPKCPKEGCT